MIISRHILSWHDELRWYERGCIVVMWVGQVMLGACLAVALAAFLLGFEHDVIDAALATMLVGFAVFFVTRSVLAIALAHRTRRHRHRRGRVRQI